MALTKEVKNDKIEVLQLDAGYPVIQVRIANIIKDDGVEISKNFHRHVVIPNQNLSEEDDDVAEIARAVFTQEVVDAYNAHLKSQKDL